ncbi:MAG: tetratricopeptide repeat protein [Clostridia bacterium]|nr:tetratricopeptide repeat protein [Clostridia bacterium]
MENITLSLYKSLLNFEKISALEFMRKNPEFLDIPGYEISKILNDGIKDGYIERFEDANKTYYSATNKCREYFERIENDKREKAEFEAKQARLKQQKTKAKVISIVSTICVVIVFLIVLNSVIIPNNKYNYAINLMSNGEYQKAIDVFEKIIEFKDSGLKKNDCLYLLAILYKEEGNYENAISLLEQISEYKDSKKLIDICKNEVLNINYNKAVQLMDNQKYSEAIVKFEELSGFKDSVEKIKEVKYKYVLANKNNDNETTFSYLKDLKDIAYNDSVELYNDLYGWKVMIFFNTSEDDHTTNLSSISVYKPVYIHVKVAGGTPNEKIKLRRFVTFPDGDTDNESWYEEYCDGDETYIGWSNGLYREPANGTRGTLSIKIYGTASTIKNESLAEGNVRITS